MFRLRNAYTDKNFDEFHRIMHDPKSRIVSDDVLSMYFTTLHCSALFSVIPYGSTARGQ